MAELGAIRVLNVLRTYERTVVKNGVNFTEHHVVFAVEGSNIDVEFDPSMDVPVGWSGRALVDLYPRIVSYPCKDGSTFRVTLFNAAKLRSFEKGYKHPELSDILPSGNQHK